MKKEEIIKMKKEEGVYVINDAGNKIEFSDGETYVKQSHSEEYRKAKIFVL